MCFVWFLSPPSEPLKISRKKKKRKEKVSHCSKGINYEIQNFLYNVAKQLLQYSAVPCRSVSSLISSQEWGTESRGRGANVSASSPKWPCAALLRGKHGELILYSHWAGCLVPSRTRKHYFLMQSPPSSLPPPPQAKFKRQLHQTVQLVVLWRNLQVLENGSAQWSENVNSSAPSWPVQSVSEIVFSPKVSSTTNCQIGANTELGGLSFDGSPVVVVDSDHVIQGVIYYR